MIPRDLEKVGSEWLLDTDCTRLQCLPGWFVGEDVDTCCFWCLVWGVPCSFCSLAFITTVMTIPRGLACSLPTFVPDIHYTTLTEKKQLWGSRGVLCFCSLFLPSRSDLLSNTLTMAVFWGRSDVQFDVDVWLRPGLAWLVDWYFSLEDS